MRSVIAMLYGVRTTERYNSIARMIAELSAVRLAVCGAGGGRAGRVDGGPLLRLCVAAA